ncbi:MAG: hypothetical protein WBC91_14085 [Phototrophicaceae bacterium]
MSPILEVLIGLIFIFSLLSILVTQINSIVAQTLRLRATYLFATVKEIIHDPEMIVRFATHPLIKMIDISSVPGMERWEFITRKQNLTDEQIEKIIQEAALTGVEWIEDRTFSSVLLSFITVTEDKQLFKVLEDIAGQIEDDQNRRLIRGKVDTVVDTGKGVDELISAVNGLPPSAHKLALVDRLRDISNEIGGKGSKTDINVSLIAGVQYIKDQYLKNALNTILTTSKNLEEAEHKLTKWFENTNYKTTELFKRDMKRYSYLIGLIIAILINVDTMYIALKLWDDPILRSAVAETASTANIDALQAQLDAAQANIDSDADSSLDEIGDSVAAAGRTLTQIQDSRIPMGWNFSDLSYIMEDDNSLEAYKLTDSRYVWNLMPWNNPNFAWLLTLKAVGIIATMLAIGQGAPFWFNILRQVR